MLYTKRLSKYKFFEFEIDAEKQFNVIRFSFELTRQQDHAGLWFNVTFPYFDLTIRIYDCRHWDYEKNDWEDK